jgi:hypothetical protein
MDKVELEQFTRFKTMKIDKNIINSYIFSEKLTLYVFYDILEMFKIRPRYVTINCSIPFVREFHIMMEEFSLGAINSSNRSNRLLLRDCELNLNPCSLMDEKYNEIYCGAFFVSRDDYYVDSILLSKVELNAKN